MIDPDSLNVWNDNRLVGYLWRNPINYIGFRYAPEWIAANGFAISRTLPLQTDKFPPESSIAHRFFANLLPEGGVRDRIVRNFKIANTDFDLLRAIGGECAGALSILPVEQTASTTQNYLPLSDEELRKLVTRRGQTDPATPAHERPRLSLAGAQDKCPVLLRDDHYFLPLKEAPSSHILKFELADYRHLPAYETFTTQLAANIGLPTVNIALCSIDDLPYALIERYDRIRDASGELRRLHQEDFCQALGYGHEKKYQEHGGPAFSECFQLVQDSSTDPVIDTQHLLRWQIFNVLAGNSDGHAKNLSLLYRQTGEIRLAPFYDLVCTRAIEHIDYHLAFAIGDQRDPGQIIKKHWDGLAEQCRVRPQYLAKLVQETTTRLLEQLGPTRTAFETQYGAHPALQRIESIVTQQCRRISMKHNY
jgi:serine/threonine-protein kinase HipA